MKLIYTDFLNDPEKPGEMGTSDTIWGMAAASQKSGHDVLIVAPYTSDNLPNLKIPVLRYAVPRFLYRNIVTQLAIAIKGARVIGGLPNVDVIHCRDQISAVALLLILSNKQIVFTSPGNIYNMIANINPLDRVSTWFSCRFQDFIAKHCPFIVATSEDLASWWIKTGTSPSRLSIIPLGVDTEVFRPILSADNILAWDRDQFHILYVGRFSVEKGILDLIHATDLLIKRGILTRLHLVGNGPLLGAIEEFININNLNDYIIFHGWVERSKLPLYYSAASVCVLPSHAEAFGRVVIESMACKCVFIGSSIGATRDLVKQGINGFQFTAGDEEELTCLLHHVATLDKKKLDAIQQSALNLVKSELSWDAVVTRLEYEVYQKAFHSRLAENFE